MPQRYRLPKFQRGKRLYLPSTGVRINGNARWGNPHMAPGVDRAEAAAKFERDLLNGELVSPAGGELLGVADAIAELPGKDVYCSCPLDEPCHGDVLLKWANRNRRPQAETIRLMPYGYRSTGGQ